MKKSLALSISFGLLLSLLLAACNFSVRTEESNQDEMAQTLVALAFTQTAVAEQAQANIKETEAPPDQVETEAVVETEATEETAAPTEIDHNVTPGEPGWINKWFYDTNSALTAAGGYVTGGDDYTANLYERPFTAEEMIYRSDVDIQKTEMSEDGTFYYVTIYLDMYHPDGGLQAAYGVEIDEDRDGRGDLLVIADRPASTTWDISGVSVHKDSNNDVGGSRIMRPDDNYSGDSYETLLFSIDVLDDPDMAWARVTDADQPYVTIAFKKSLIARDTFVWGVWASDSLLDPALMDLHDHFTQEEAGSPYPSHSTFPLRNLNLVDNTCRETYKFEATTPIPGLCYIPEPTPTPVPTQEPLGDINGVAFDDNNNNGVRNEGEPLTIYRVTISLHSESCSNPALQTTTAKSFDFPNLVAGCYCLKIVGGGTMTTPSSYSISLTPGASVYREFGFYVVK